jgi:hypothetical protein
MTSLSDPLENDDDEPDEKKPSLTKGSDPWAAVKWARTSPAMAMRLEHTTQFNSRRLAARVARTAGGEPLRRLKGLYQRH